MTRTAQIVEVLGGPVILRDSSSPAQLRAWIRDGLPFATLDAIIESYRLGRETLSEVLTIPMRT